MKQCLMESFLIFCLLLGLLHFETFEPLVISVIMMGEQMMWTLFIFFLGTLFGIFLVTFPFYYAENYIAQKKKTLISERVHKRNRNSELYYEQFTPLNEHLPTLLVDREYSKAPDITKRNSRESLQRESSSGRTVKDSRELYQSDRLSKDISPPPHKGDALTSPSSHPVPISNSTQKHDSASLLTQRQNISQLHSRGSFTVSKSAPHSWPTFPKDPLATSPVNENGSPPFIFPMEEKSSAHSNRKVSQGESVLLSPTERSPMSSQRQEKSALVKVWKGKDWEILKNTKNIATTFFVLKSNVIFHYKKENDRTPFEILNMDAFDVTLREKTIKAKPIWKQKNVLILYQKNTEPPKEPNNTYEQTILEKELSCYKNVDWKSQPLPEELSKSNSKAIPMPAQSAPTHSMAPSERASLKAPLPSSLKINLSEPLKSPNPNVSTLNGAKSPREDKEKDKIFIQFETARALEIWYYALQKAAYLKTEKSKEHRLAKQYFSKLGSIFRNWKIDPAPDWFAIVLSRAFWYVYNTETFLFWVRGKLEKKISKIEKPNLIAAINVADLEFGPNVPIFKNIGVVSFTDEGEIELCGDIEYQGGFHLTLEIIFEIEVIKKKFSMPFVVSVTVNSVNGRGHLYIGAPPANTFWIGFYQEPQVELSVNTEIAYEGHSFKDIPKLANIIVEQIKAEIMELMLLPHMEDFPLPKVPKSKVPLKKSN